jgi:hypothetical protein
MINKFLLSHWKIMLITSAVLGLAAGTYYILFCLPPLPKTMTMPLSVSSFRL